MNVRSIILARDARALRAWLLGRFKVDVGEGTAALFADQAWDFATGEGRRNHDGFPLWPGKTWRFLMYEDDDTWAMWFNNRLRENGFGWVFRGRGRGSPEINLPVTLHAGFLSLLETEDELALLRGDLDAVVRHFGPRWGPALTEKVKEVLEEQRTKESQVARSKITRTPLKVVPIDRVAARVGPSPSKGDR